MSEEKKLAPAEFERQYAQAPKPQLGGMCKCPLEDESSVCFYFRKRDATNPYLCKCHHLAACHKGEKG